MSGGAYEYVQDKDIDDILFYPEHLIRISRIAQDLAEAGEIDAANATEAVIARVRQLADQANDVNAELKDLYWVWRALDWWKSGDSGEERFHEAVQTWRDEVARRMYGESLRVLRPEAV